MFLFLIILMVLLFLTGLIFFAGIFLSKKIVFDREKMSPFECGFTPKFNARMPFSMRFFLIALIFLVFDVELVLMFPYVLGVNWGSIFTLIFFLMVFLSILVLGLSHEWNQGSLDWTT